MGKCGKQLLFGVLEMTVGQETRSTDEASSLSAVEAADIRVPCGPTAITMAEAESSSPRHFQATRHPRPLQIQSLVFFATSCSRGMVRQEVAVA